MAAYSSLFKGVVSDENIRENEPMSRHTTFKTGGSADLMLLPASEDELLEAVKLCSENSLPYLIIGNGSNLLVTDKGIRGVVIKLGRDFAKIDLEGNVISAQAGALLSATANAALKAELSGMEFAAGIPGTVGGAVCMNAGAYGGELKDIIKEVRVLDKDEVKTLSNTQAGFVYRGSRVMNEGMIVLSAVFELEKGSKEDIRSLMDDYSQRRRSKQPLDKPSAGSTFKRPEGDFAGRLIEAAGLKGCSIGGAKVSDKHCGFIINDGGASSTDILELIDFVRKKVYESSGTMLEPEVRIIGEL